MKYLVIVSTLFVIGSLLGYLIEVLFRRIFTAKKWINPGFLVGPYIPLYGFGVLILYGLSNIPFSTFFVNPAIGHMINVLLIGISLTVIELITGLLFINGLHLKLWDYSNRWGNFKGVICPLFSFIWFVVGCLYFYLINPYLVKGISWISDNLVYSFFIGAVIGMMIVDSCYSIHLGLKIKKFSSNLTVKYEQFKSDITVKDENDKKRKFFGTLINIQSMNKSLSESIKKHVENLPKVHRWWKKK